MIDFLDSLNWTISFFLLALVFMVFTTIGIFFVRKAANLRHIKDCHDMTGIIFSNLGALYAVLLGFTIVNAQERFDQVKKATQTEVSLLIDLYRDADLFLGKERKTIEGAILEYIESIISQEWSQKSPNEETGRKFKNLLKAYYDAEIGTEKQKIWYTQAVEQLNILSDLRLARILGSQETIGPQMWAILILGGGAMVLFLWFFGPEKPLQHLLMASILAITIACSLLLIHSLDSAFTGNVSIRSDDLQKLLHVIKADLSSL